MPKQYNIRWRTQDYKNLSIAVRTFNAKRTRLIKQVPELEAFLPKKLNVKEIREEITTRREFNERIASIKRFQKKDATKLVKVSQGDIRTQYEKREIELAIRKINRARAKRLKEINASPETGTIGVVERNNLKPKQFNPKNINSWEQFVKSVHKQSNPNYYIESDYRYLETYKSAVKDFLGEYAKDVLNELKNVGAQRFVIVSLKDPFLTIDYLYDPNDMEEKAKLIVERLKLHFG